MRDEDQVLRLGLPKGRMWDGVRELLEEAGIRLRSGSRSYRPELTVDGVEAKVLKPQNLVGMLAAGSRDLAFAGADWVAELEADLVELLDTGLEPVRLVAAAPEALVEDGHLPDRPLVVASEYEHLTRRWIRDRGLDATFVKSFGATEVFPPDDADCIVDNTASGRTLSANHLAIVDELMTSSTRLYTTRRVLDDPAKRKKVEDLVLLVESVLEARQRVMLEMNVPAERLDELLALLPCMREPTIAPLHHGAGYAVKVAAPHGELPNVIPQIKACGGTDLVVSSPSQIVP